MDSLRFDMLFERHLDNQATPEELNELAAMLRENSEFRRELVERTRLEVTLHDILGTRAVANRPSVRAKMGRPKFGRRPRQESNSWIVLAGIVATILVVLGIYLGWSRSTYTTNEEVVARINLATHAKLLRAGSSEALANGRALLNDDSVSTIESGRIDIDYIDGTRVSLVAGGTVKLTFAGAGKVLRVQAGEVSATVAKQPKGKPMLFVSSTAQATVVGTQLKFAVLNDATRLEVAEGLVNLKRLSDGKAVNVAAGQSATAAFGKELVVESIAKTTPIPATVLLPLGKALISEDFENGRIEGWTQGSVVTGGAGNSRYAIAADTKLEAGSSTRLVFSAVQLPLSRLQGGSRDNEWIFEYKSGFILQFSYYLERDAGAIRVQGFNVEQADNFGSTLDHPVVGSWTTVQMPVDDFRHNNSLERTETLKPGTHFKSLQFETGTPAQKFLIDNVIVAPIQTGASPTFVPSGGVR